MASTTLFFFLCIMIMFRLSSAIWLQNNCPGVGRQPFAGAVARGFRRAHFRNANEDLGARRMSLNHVLSWRAIYEKIENGMQAAYDARTRSSKNRSKNNIFKFVNALFSIDQDGYVRKHYDGTRPDGVDHATYLNANPGGAPETLARINRNKQESALNIVNRMNFANAIDCVAIQDLLTDLNNAPANLRIGEEDSIGNLLDPMGDENGIMTKKEHRFYIQDGYILTRAPTLIRGSYYLESSTGKRITGRPDGWWIRCYHNTPNCEI